MDVSERRFLAAHHEAWRRSDFNQRQYFEAEDVPLKTFGNLRAIFKAEPQPPERKLLYRRRGLSHPLRTLCVDNFALGTVVSPHY